MTETEIAKEIVHKMIDNTELAEDAYPNLRKRLHDAVDEYEPNNSEKPNNCEPKICDTCRYYNSNIPCGSTPSACKEADKFAEEFVDGLKKLKSKTEPQTDCPWK